MTRLRKPARPARVQVAWRYTDFLAFSPQSQMEVAVADFSSHKPGTFSWPELSTTDQKGAVAFYRALFGWDLNDVPMGPGDTYSIFQMRGKSVGSAYTMRPDERSMGIPPHWNSYVTVA